MKNFTFVFLAFLFIGIDCSYAQSKLIEKIERNNNPFFLPYERYELDNGLTIIVHEDHSDPIVHVDVTYHVGSAREELGRSGFAHFYEHMMFQGSDNVDDEEHFKIVSAAGGTLNGTTNTDRTNYFETLPANQLEVALWLESDRMGFLLDAVTQKKFEIQRSTVKNERGQNYDNRPYGLVNEKIGQALYPYGHPYNWPTIGYISDLNRATLDDLKQFFLRWYGPNNATLTVTGDVKPADVVKLAEKYFGKIPVCPAIPEVDKTPVALESSRYISYEDNVRQPLLVITYPTVPMHDNDEVALDALADILSGNKNSPIYRKFVYDQKALSASTYHPTQELGGKFMFSSLPMPGTTLENLEFLFNDVLDELKANGISDEEVESFKTKTEASLLNSIASVSGKASTLASGFVFSKNPNELAADYDRLMKLKASDVMRVFEKYIYKKPAIVLSVYPKGQPEMIAKFNNYLPDTTKVYEKAFIPQKSNLKYVKAKDSFDRSKQPTPGVAPVLKTPEIWSQTLDNKLKVIGTYSDEIPMVNFQVSVEAGHFYDPLDKAGLAALTAEMFKESTIYHSGELLSQALSNLGSRIDVYANNTDIVFNISCMNKYVDTTLSIFKEMLYTPVMDQDEFRKVKNKQLQTINNQKAQASVVASNAFNAYLFGDKHIFSLPTIGTPETVDKIEIEDVRNYFETHFSPHITTLVVVGKLQKAEALKKLAFLNDWKKVNTPVVAEAAIPTISKTKIYFMNKDNAPQSEIRMGYVAMPYDAYGEYYNASLMNFILGGAFNSRINLNLREDKGYTYGARSSFTGSKFKGPFMVATGVRASATDSSLVEIMKELKKYRDSGISNDELKFTKNSIGLSEALKYETNGQKAGYLNRIISYNLEPNFAEKQSTLLTASTKASIDAAAKKYLPLDKMAIVIVGDKSTVLDPLKKLGYDIEEYNAEGTFVELHKAKTK